MNTKPIFAFLLLLPLLGCSPPGPTPEERLKTALEILELQETRLAAKATALNSAREKAIATVIKEVTGLDYTAPGLGSSEDIMKAAQQALGGLGTATTLDPNSKDFDKALEQAASAAQASAANSGKIAGTLEKIKTPGTEEAKRLEELLQATPEQKEYDLQAKKVEDAKAEVAAAEAEVK